MAKATAASRRRRNRRRGSAGLPGGTVLVVVLLACAGLAAWTYRAELGTALAPTAGGDDTAQTPPKKVAKARPAPEAPPPAEATDRFEFYDMLPDAEVDVPEQPRATGAAGPPPVSVPGTYVVQAGAFPNFAEADKVKARLALLGVVSQIQAAEANGATFHRVRIGPIDNLNELNRLRARLRQNGIEYLVIPVGE
ncbi:MAG: SPOR domain-containing protein [Chromatiales bacterium]|nr:SPOR domain-containing protein [Chromatiales bacterium]